MNIILLEKIANLGNLGDKVTVRPGYGRNYLIPQGKACVATPAKVAEFEVRRIELEKKAAAELAQAEARREALAKLDICITQKAGEEGRLYGSVGTKDIADAISALGVKVGKSEVKLPHGAIRLVGDYEIKLQIHGDVDAIVKVRVVPA